MSRQNKERYEFEKFHLDISERLLSREGERLPLPEKAFDTLCALVKRGNRLVSKDELMNDIWADANVEENNLDKNISLLRQVLGERIGKGKFIETVRGHGFRFVPEVREIEEIEEAKIRGQEQAGTGENSQQNTESQLVTAKRESRYWLAAIVTLALAGLSLFAFSSFREKAHPLSPSIKTLAVLPFKPLATENRDETLELGMADALISKLSDGEDIAIRPLSAIRRFNSVEQDAVAAGRELGVEAVLEGSLQISGDRIRVLTKLIRTLDGKQLWASHFDENFTDIFAVQDSISQKVAVALKTQLGDKEKKRYTEDIEAYQLYMKGRYHALRLTRAETDKGIAYFQKAIELDPNYALAYVGLASTYIPMALTSGVPSWEVMPKAKEAALRAVEIDGNIPEAHITLGFIKFWYDWDWQAAEKEFLQSLALNSNSADGHFAYAHLLANTGRFAQGVAEIKRARELDPLSLIINSNEGQILFFQGRYDEALDRLEKTIDLEPNFWLSHLFISRVFTEKGMHAEAVAAARKAGELSNNSQSSAYRAYALVKWGRLNEARALLKELLSLSVRNYVPPYNMAVVYNALDDPEKAIDYLEKGYSEKDPKMVFLKVEPMWNNLRVYPRFVSLLRRMRLEE